MQWRFGPAVVAWTMLALPARAWRHQTALDCLAKTRAVAGLAYPSDAEKHFDEVHRALAPWISASYPHTHGGYSGPWLENHWIGHFGAAAAASRKRGGKLRDVFGEYIPLLVPWVDLWVNTKSGDRVLKVDKYHYPGGFAQALLNATRPSVRYVTVSQNAEGLEARDALMRRWFTGRGNVLVLSAGGYGHVALPLLKQVEPRNNQRNPADRGFFVSFVGSLHTAPCREAMREAVERSSVGVRVFVGQAPDWRQVMADSRFSLCPRGFGRTSYHLAETMNMGLVPIHVYADVPWVPYPALYRRYGFLARADELPALLQSFRHNVTDAALKRREAAVLAFSESHFTYDAVMLQIRAFLRDGASDLRCVRLPDSPTGA
ncbi:hypothetical protein M885DRAFT_518142 [Pelagophyceae sp. CCMP2097]|nr:hypothetical protein M885DRAFT_518142 [Pelagophyceae sp. CCMP2097]|mmetsp:Transcript_19332/g.65317  ORF Transcript_19332/g.65317 Transcript_19332/m.65317 type:complete len:375 (-) Transcript_19332:201-1325(-)